MSRYKDLTGQKFGKLIANFFINDTFFWNCTCECGSVVEVVGKSLRAGKTKSCGKSGCKVYPIRFDITNQKFGFLTAKSFLPDGKWLCICDCGKEAYVLSNSLRFGTTKSCGCKTLELSNIKKVLPDNMAAVNSIFYSYKLSASKRKLEFSLLKEFFIDLIYKNCFYCGIPPMHTTIKLNSYHKSAPKEISYNGIDRVNNDLGYTESNSITCCRICNRAKSNMPYEDFLIWIEHMVAYRIAMRNAA